VTFNTPTGVPPPPDHVPPDIPGGHPPPPEQVPPDIPGDHPPPPSSVPEPATGALALLGLAAVRCWRRKK
jgi:MYXO-CTERM domain-containing protein